MNIKLWIFIASILCSMSMIQAMTIPQNETEQDEYVTNILCLMYEKELQGIHKTIQKGREDSDTEIAYEAVSLVSNGMIKKRLADHLEEAERNDLVFVATGSAIKKHICNVCVKSCTSSTHLVKHKRIHTNERPYICGVCEASFIQSGHLVEHTRIHTGEKPFMCQVCQKGFVKSGDLTLHQWIHSDSKPYICELCHEGFANLRRYDRHKEVHAHHKPYDCDMCHIGFTELRSLTRHIRKKHEI